MRLLIAAALVLPLQATALDDYYKFKVGTTWSYARSTEGTQRKVVGRVTSDEGGKIPLEWKDYEKDGTLHRSSTVIWSVQDGMLTAEAREEGADSGLAFALLKEGSKKDDHWPSPGGTMTHRGTAEVTVPAGTYKNAIWTQLQGGDDSPELKVDFYIVPHVGLVKAEIHAPGAEVDRFELTEFKEAKK